MSTGELRKMWKIAAVAAIVAVATNRFLEPAAKSVVKAR